MSSDGEFSSLQDAISASLVATTRTTGQLVAEDLGFLRSTSRSAARKLDKQNARLLDIAQRLINNAAANTPTAPPELRNFDDIEDNWRGVVDVVDSLLERADKCLDEYNGVIKKLGTTKAKVAQTLPPPASEQQRPGMPRGNGRNQHLPKPQLLFQNVPRNDETTAFKPLIRSKPHAVVPFEESVAPVAAEGDLSSYRHPYGKEISVSKFPPATYVKAEPIPSRPYDDTTSAIFVDTPEAVVTMLAELRQAKEIAIDLEHHDAHSYIGIVCLMQISTRDKDWIVDTLKPWREDLQVLNEVFADPAILKVFHGSTSDMVWLQRDLGLYVVGLFDTYHATYALGYPKHSLAYLLQRFENFTAQKQYQMADWRTRPLGKELLDYAQSDTHFLLHVYDSLRNELIDATSALPEGEQSLIDYVCDASKQESLQRYERPFYDEQGGMGSNGWFMMLVRTPALFTKEQFAVFRAVHTWRDKLARQADESPNSIMRKDVIFSIARVMPDDMASLIGCSHPMSQLIRTRVGELLGVVKKAKAAGATGPDMQEVMDAHPATIEFRARQKEREAARLPKQSATPSLAEVIRNEREAAKTSNAVHKSEQSAFWGSTIVVMGSKRKHGEISQIDSNMADLRLIVPIPPLIDVDPDVQSTVQHQKVQEAVSIPRPPPEPLTEDQEQIFTLKELRKSRKRKKSRQSSDDDAPLDRHPSHVGELDADEMALGSAESEAVALAKAKAERKRAKKTAKREKKAQAALAAQSDQLTAEGDVNLEMQEEQPFDYANAPSVLNAKTDAAGRKKKEKEKEKEKVFDPYKKALDAPKGLGRSRKETAGKSMTFKS